MDEMRRRARDPQTSWEELRYLAEHRPDLRADIAANPNLYPGLRNWLASLGDPEINRVLRGDPLTGSLPAIQPPAAEEDDPKRPFLIGAAVLLAILIASGGAYAAFGDKIFGGDEPTTEAATAEPTDDMVTEDTPSPSPTTGDDESPDLDTPLPSGERLDMETDYTGPITSTPFDSDYRYGIVPGHELEGRFIGMSSDADIIVTSTPTEVIGWDLVTGVEKWRSRASIDLDWDPYVSQSADNLIISGNQGIDKTTGKVTTLPIPDSAYFCGGYSDLVVFALGQDLVGLKSNGTEAWRATDVLGGYTIGQCAFYDTYVRVHPDNRQVDPVTLSASTGSPMSLPSLEGWYNTSYLLPNGVVMSTVGLPASRTAPIGEGEWAAWDLSSGDLLASAPFTGEPDYLPRLYSTPTSDINLYAEAINHGWDEGYLLARSGKILATATVSDDGLVRTIVPVDGTPFDLPSAIVNKSARHTLTILDDNDTLIASPAESREGDPLHDGFVAAYSLSTGEQLWSYTLGPTEQVYVTSGFLWVVDSSRLTTIFYTPAQ